MSIIDKVVSAVTPEPSDTERGEARAKARAAAVSGDWLSQALQQHVQIESAFAAVKAAREPGARSSAQRWLGTVLTGHADAEESVIYPALALSGEQSHANTAYAEQAEAKTGMYALSLMDPMSEAYLAKLEEIRKAVANHVYEEESKWFLEVKSRVSAADQVKLTQRFKEEFHRYLGSDAAA